MPESPQPQPSPSPEKAAAKAESGVSPAPVAPISTAGSGTVLGRFWILISRLLLLGIVAGLGWMVGLLLAQILPGSIANPPLPEVMARKVNHTLRKLRQLPQWWRDDGGGATNLALPPGPLAVTGESPADSPLPQLSAADQARIETEIQQLHQSLITAETDITRLETDLGQSGGGLSLERRLQQLERTYDRITNPDAGNRPPVPTASTAVDMTATAPADNGWTPVSDRIVLPSTLMFDSQTGALTASGQQLLETILPDLLRYPGATLLVGSHGSASSDPTAERERTFHQAVAVRDYLDQRLGKDFRWVTIGYGQSRPRVGSQDPAAQARNQRVEIAILPGQ